MAKVLVVGDLILDEYRFCEAKRICPEAPALVLQKVTQDIRRGGAGLVASQLQELGVEVHAVYGSTSRKERIFAGRTLVCRIDKDSVALSPIITIPDLAGYSAVIVSDYNKGAISPEIADSIGEQCGLMSIPLFVDSKSDIEYENVFAAFPNEHECFTGYAHHIVRKLGARGCEVDGQLVETEEQLAYDVTGAGDVFLAAFVAEWLRSGSLMFAAYYANNVAGESVKHIGSYVVPKEAVAA